MALGPGLCFFGGGLRSWLQSGEVDLFEQLVPAEKNSDMRAVEFVGRTRQEIAAEGLNVHQIVRRKMNGIYKAQCPGLSRHAANQCRIVDRPDSVRRGTDCDKPSSVIYQPGQLFHFEFTCLDV